MRKLLILIPLFILLSGCVVVTGRDKNVLDSTYVWAYSTHEIIKEKIENGEKLDNLEIKELFDKNRKMWAFFVGASEGKTSTDILNELKSNEDEMFKEVQ